MAEVLALAAASRGGRGARNSFPSAVTRASAASPFSTPVDRELLAAGQAERLEVLALQELERQTPIINRFERWIRS